MPDAAPYEVLTRFERFAFRVMRSWNGGPVAGLARLYQRYVLIPFVGSFVAKRITILGLDKVPREGAILLVANHRTFFDLFVLAWIFLRRGSFSHKVSFPVRANFFYEGPLGLMVCLGMSGGTMFPPFFRATEKKLFNRHSLGLLIEKMKEPGNLVGFHPEGTRSKTDDPYTLLPAQPGVGELAIKARPIVIPAFINGLSNSMWQELKNSLSGKPRVIAVYGEPIPFGELPEETRLSHHKRFADLCNDHIAALGQEEKTARAEGPAP